MTLNYRKSILLLANIIFLISFFYFDFDEVVNLEYLQSHVHTLVSYYNLYPVESILLFCCAFILCISLSLPGSLIFSVSAGAIFGVKYGIIITALSGTTGAVIGLLLFRYIFRDYVTGKYAGQVQKVNKGIEKDGALYLFSLRTLPFVPFSVINMGVAITSMSPLKFGLITLVGSFAIKFMFVNAGATIYEIETIADIATNKMVVLVGLVMLIPVIIKLLMIYKKN